MKSRTQKAQNVDLFIEEEKRSNTSELVLKYQNTVKNKPKKKP